LDPLKSWSLDFIDFSQEVFFSMGSGQHPGLEPPLMLPFLCTHVHTPLRPGWDFLHSIDRGLVPQAVRKSAALVSAAGVAAPDVWNVVNSLVFYHLITYLLFKTLPPITVYFQLEIPHHTGLLPQSSHCEHCFASTF
jgi:hypothetical protein